MGLNDFFFDIAGRLVDAVWPALGAKLERRPISVRSITSSTDPDLANALDLEDEFMLNNETPDREDRRRWVGEHSAGFRDHFLVAKIGRGALGRVAAYLFVTHYPAERLAYISVLVHGRNDPEVRLLRPSMDLLKRADRMFMRGNNKCHAFVFEVDASDLRRARPGRRQSTRLGDRSLADLTASPFDVLNTLI